MNKLIVIGGNYILTILNRDYKQSFDDIEREREFHYCQVLVMIDDIMDEEGYLIAISEDPSTYEELCRYRGNYSSDTLFYLGGWYKHEAGIGIQNVTD